MERGIELFTVGFILVLGLNIIISSCQKEDPPVMEDTSMQLVSGGNQTSDAESTLASPVEVLVKDQEGNAFQGAKVNFAVMEGSVSIGTATTDASGIARTTWTLGTTAGTQTVTVTAYKTNGTTSLSGSPIAVTATANELIEATSIELVLGGDQSGNVESMLGDPIKVLVKDQNGNPFQGARVNFSVAEGSVSSASETTDASGNASIAWTLGTTAGTQTLSITAFKADGTTALTGSPLSVNATANAILEATSIELVSGGSQIGNIGTALPNPIVLIVKDQVGDPFQGVTVNFAVAEGSVSSASETTNVSGNVSVSWTLGSTEGIQTLTVTSFKADGTTHLDNSPLLVNATAEAGNETGTVTDIDGNVYNTVTIGTQTWMVENLKTTKYNDGTEIPNVTDAGTWAGLSTPGYCWYENNIANKTTYGALYNWYTLNTTKLAPTGWHVPTDAEFATLTTYLGGAPGAAGKLKEISTTHWESPNSGATNETGFTALPGGFRGIDGVFGSIGLAGFWWDATEYFLAGGGAYLRYMSYNSSGVASYGYKKEHGFSIRCVKD